MLTRGDPQALGLSTSVPLEVNGSPLGRSSMTALLALKTERCLTETLLSVLYKCQAECPQPAVPTLQAKGRDTTLWPRCGGDSWKSPWWATSFKGPACQPAPTAPHPGPLPGLCEPGEPVFWDVFSRSCVGCTGLKCPPGQGPFTASTLLTVRVPTAGPASPLTHTYWKK